MARVDNLAGWRTGAKIQIPGLIGSRTMSLTAEQGEGIKNELKRIAGDLNLSDEQKTKLHERLSSAADKLHEYKKSHPNVTRQDIIKAVGSHRAELRAGLERFLTPEQLKKWDAEVAKAKEFLGFAAA
jgi:periplasmic protein CpxP/Spy